MASLVYVNGDMVPADEARVSALDRGFTLGDGIFDTMRSVGGRVFRMEDHLTRFESSARALGMALPLDRAALVAAIDAVLDANGLADALVRVTVSRGVPASRGLLPPVSPSPTVVIAPTPFGSGLEDAYERGYRVQVATIRRNEHSPLSRIKSCNYLDSVLARMEAAERGADEALLLNTAGRLACGSSSNVFLVIDGALLTPSLECGVLDGVTRRTVLVIASALGIPSEQRHIRPEELCTAEEAFVTNTAIGVMPVVAVDGRAVGDGTPGETCRRIQETYEALLGSAEAR